MLSLDNSSCSQNAGGTGEIITVGRIQAFSGKTEASQYKCHLHSCTDLMCDVMFDLMGKQAFHPP